LAVGLTNSNQPFFAKERIPYIEVFAEVI